MGDLLYRGRAWWIRGPATPATGIPYRLPGPPVPSVPLPLEFLRCPLPRILPDDNESVKAIRAIEAQIQTLKGRP